MNANAALKSETPSRSTDSKTLSPHARPRLRQPYRLAGFTDRFGSDYWIIGSLDGKNYLNLNKAERFFLEQMDGQRTVANLNIEYSKVHRALGDRVLHELLVKLQTRGFLEKPLLVLDAPKPERSAGWRKLWSARFRLWEIDPVVTQLYQRSGRLLFTPVARVLVLSIIIAGLILFSLQLYTGAGRFLQLQKFSALEVMSVWLTLPIWMFFHESAHALTCKAHGLKLGEFGIVIGMGVPAPYINTNDTWMAAPRERVMVSIAGPCTNLLIAGLCATLAYGIAAIQPYLLRLAALNYLLTFVNLNPWVESDGYFLLMDYLRVPGLRAGARKFIRREFLGLIRHGWKGLTPRQRIFVAYWFGSFVYSALITPIVTVILAVSLYRLVAGFVG